MDIYYTIWKIVGIVFLLFLAYSFIIVRFFDQTAVGKKNEQNVRENNPT